MTRLEERCAEVVAERCHLSRAEVERLFEAQLVDLRVAERLLMRRAVEMRSRAGEPRCEAMMAVAQEVGCSYEKVRAAVYAKEL